ncbi:hypothetical protein M3Y94_00625600 [Aphelenchoides besseyi]|nr:hypothetical protein M3Y94_00625600 [Aphelenchoides besseyi]
MGNSSSNASSNSGGTHVGNRLEISSTKTENGGKQLDESPQNLDQLDNDKALLLLTAQRAEFKEDEPTRVDPNSFPKTIPGNWIKAPIKDGRQIESYNP